MHTCIKAGNVSTKGQREGRKRSKGVVSTSGSAPLRGPHIRHPAYQVFTLRFMTIAKLFYDWQSPQHEELY